MYVTGRPIENPAARIAFRLSDLNENRDRAGVAGPV